MSPIGQLCPRHCKHERNITCPDVWEVDPLDNPPNLLPTTRRVSLRFISRNELMIMPTGQDGHPKLKLRMRIVWVDFLSNRALPTPLYRPQSCPHRLLFPLNSSKGKVQIKNERSKLEINKIQYLTRNLDHLSAKDFSDLEPQVQFLDHEVMCLGVKQSVVVHEWLQDEYF